jgi:ABC-2 type transport system permease protein
MRNFIAICKKEFISYFCSPIAYVVITMFLIISGYFFQGILGSYIQISFAAMRDPYIAQFLNFTEGIFRPLFGNTSIVMLLMMPLLTMRLLAEEKKNGTFELLLTYPIRDIETVLAKFAACLLVFAIMLGLTLVYPLFLKSLEWKFLWGEFAQTVNLEMGPLLSSYLGLLLMGGAFIAFGLLASSLTSNQIVAAVISFGALLLFWVIGFSAQTAGPVLGNILKHLSLLDHFDTFSKGVIDSRDVIYYLNFTVFCLFLTLRSLESNKWRG